MTIFQDPSLAGGFSVVQCEEGIMQGCMLSMLVFALLQPVLTALFGPNGKHRRAIMPSGYADDLTLCCIAAAYHLHFLQLTHTLRDLELALRPLGLALTFSKTVLGLLRTAPGKMSVIPTEDISEENWPHVADQRLVLELNGFELLGAPFGASTPGGVSFVKGFFAAKAATLRDDVAALSLILQSDPQIFYHLLQCCLHPICMHLPRCYPPDSLLLDLCAEVHTTLITAFFSVAAGTPPALLRQRVHPALISVVAAQASLPVGLGGFGLRDLRNVVLAAWPASWFEASACTDTHLSCHGIDPSSAKGPYTASLPVLRRLAASMPFLASSSDVDAVLAPGVVHQDARQGILDSALFRSLHSGFQQPVMDAWSALEGLQHAARLLSLGSADSLTSYGWLTQLPTDDVSSLPCNTFRCVVAIRLGLPPRLAVRCDPHTCRRPPPAAASQAAPQPLTLRSSTSSPATRVTARNCITDWC
jgi:hypothetical protein